MFAPGHERRIPGIVAKIPGLRRVWPGKDSGLVMTEAGDMQPRYDFMAAAHSRLKDYHQAALKAYTDQRGLYSPPVQKALEKGGLYRWKPGPKDTPADPVAGAMNIGGVGLLGTGNAGIARALGAKAGGAVMQTWNAAMAGGGAWQNQRQGPKNAKGKTYKPPKDYPTEYARRLAARHR